MAVSMARHMWAALPELRFQPTQKRVRVDLGDTMIADTDRAMLVWEPMRVVPSYAVPEADIHVDVRPAPPQDRPEYRPVSFGTEDGALLDPSVPFGVHTADGDAVSIGAADGAGFRLADPGLNGHLILEFEAFEWREEDEPIVGHPRDPFHRIDVRRSSRTVRLESDGVLLAATDRAQMLFEGIFPFPRFYLPKPDVRVELRPGTMQTTCAYKGHATHYTAVLPDRELPNIAWSYEEPLSDALQVAGLVSFYQEHLDLTVDGGRLDRVRSPWS